MCIPFSSINSVFNFPFQIFNFCNRFKMSTNSFLKRDTYTHTHTHIVLLCMSLQTVCYLTLSLLLPSFLTHILFVSWGNDPFVNALIIFRKWIGCCSLLMAQCVSVFIACVHGRCQILPLGISIFNCIQVCAHVGRERCCFGCTSLPGVFSLNDGLP